MPLTISNENLSKKVAKLVVRAEDGGRGTGYFEGKRGDICLLSALDVEDERGEDRLRADLRDAFDHAAARGLEAVEIEVATFAEQELAPYALSVIAEAADDFLAEGSADLTISVVNPIVGDDCGFDPKGRYVEQRSALQAKGYVYGEEGDPLVKEFNRFTKEMPKELTFRQMIRLKMAEKGVKSRSVVYTRAGVSKETFSKIMNEEGNGDLENYKPNKRTVAALAIGLRLDIEEAEEFFHAAGYHLGTEELPDQIFRFFVGVKRNYNIFQINSCLRYYGYRMLGTQVRGDSGGDGPQHS